MLDGGTCFPGSEPYTIARMAADHGFGHITFQWDYVPQRALLAQAREACHDYGLTFGVWESEPQPFTGTVAVDETGADHYIAQAETPRNWVAIVDSFRAAYPALPAAVVTTFGGIGALDDGTYDPSIAKPVIDAGFRCLTEAYVNVDAGSTPDRMRWTAIEKLGWPWAQQTIGVYGGYPAERYIVEHNLADHRGYWVWLAETMTARDWAVLREHNLGV